MRSAAFGAAPVSAALSSALDAAGVLASPDTALPDSNTCCKEPLAHAPFGGMPSILSAVLAVVAGVTAGDVGAVGLVATELVATLLAAAAGSDTAAGSDELP